jgi:putative ABC transport system ATP-binding protein
MKNILEALDVKKTYKVGKIEVAALRGVSIRMREGEFISIMGPSGCGKSTLLHILGGLAKPTSGKVVIDGEEISAVKDGARTDIRRRKIGFVFQRYNLLSHSDWPGQSRDRTTDFWQRKRGRGAHSECSQVVGS